MAVPVTAKSTVTVWLDASDKSTVRAFQRGISDYNKKVSFYYPPNYSVMSSFFRKTVVDEQIIQLGIKITLKLQIKIRKLFLEDYS